LKKYEVYFLKYLEIQIDEILVHFLALAQLDQIFWLNCFLVIVEDVSKLSGLMRLFWELHLEALQEPFAVILESLGTLLDHVPV